MVMELISPWWSGPCHMSLLGAGCCRLLQLARAHLPAAVSDNSSCYDPNPIQILHGDIDFCRSIWQTL